MSLFGNNNHGLILSDDDEYIISDCSVFLAIFLFNHVLILIMIIKYHGYIFWKAQENYIFSLQGNSENMSITQLNPNMVIYHNHCFTWCILFL